MTKQIGTIINGSLADGLIMRIAPETNLEHIKTGKFVSKNNLIVGDLVFFTTTDSNGKIGHVGIYTGDGQMIHTYGDGGVRYVSIYKDWWKDHYVTARRVI